MTGTRDLAIHITPSPLYAAADPLIPPRRQVPCAPNTKLLLLTDAFHYNRRASGRPERRAHFSAGNRDLPSVTVRSR